MYMAERDKSKDLKVDDIGSYTATKADIGEADLVQSRIGGVMNDSNLRNQAIGTANSQAGSRGLINSQMNTQGAVEELYKAALPIASQDSTSLIEGKKFNASTMNEAGRFNTGEKNKGIIENIRSQNNLDSIYERGRSDYSIQTLRGTQELSQIGARGAIEMGLQDRADAGAMSRLNVSGDQALAQIVERGDIDINLETLRATSDQTIADIKAKNDRLISANQAASLVYSNTQVAIANVLTSAAAGDIPKANVQGYVDILNGELERSLLTIGTFADVNVSGLLPAVDPEDAGTGDSGSAASNDPANYDPGANTNYGGDNDYRTSENFG